MPETKKTDLQAATVRGAGNPARLSRPTLPRRPEPLSRAERLHYEGVEALSDQRLEDAVLAFREAVELDPSLDRAWNDLAVVMAAMGNPMEAVRCYDKALTADPSNPGTREDLNRLLVEMNLAEALRHQAFTSSVL